MISWQHYSMKHVKTCENLHCLEFWIATVARPNFEIQILFVMLIVYVRPVRWALISFLFFLSFNNNEDAKWKFFCECKSIFS